MSVRVHVGDVLTGKINATIPATSASWSATLNDSGAVSATVAEAVVRDFNLRGLTNGQRCFLAFERDGRIKQAGPIRSRQWDWEKGQLTLGAVGIWGWLDRRVIRPAALTLPIQADTVIVSGKSLGGLARALVQLATSTTYCNVPIVLPADETGDHTETFPLYSLLKYGEQLRQITARATDAPDIAFVPRRRSDDPRYIEWVMRVGTASAPALQQTGPDWIFDTSVPKSSTFGISTDEDATSMAEQVWVTGNGQEESILMSQTYDTTLLQQGWPLTEVDEAHPTVEDQATIDGHAANLLARSARPIEVFKATVAADAVQEAQPGDYCQIVTRGDVWLGDTNRETRVKTISGDMSDRVTLDMYPLAAAA